MRIRNSFFIPVVYVILLACLFKDTSAEAQTFHQLPPNQPEQDACNALTICGNTFSTPFSYVGTGNNADLISTPCYTGTSSNGGEINAMWMKLTIASAGRIVFTITPANKNDDYDFAVLNVTGFPCGYTTPKQVVRCNFNGRQQGANDNGVIGLSATSSLLYVENGSSGSSFCEAVDAMPGETYLIMINNFGDYLSLNPVSRGFTIDFTGSNATFYNNNLAQINNADPLCGNSTSLFLHMSHPVLCNSIAADGSDFSIDAPAAIKGATGIFCSSDGGYTSTLVLSLSSPLPVGNYFVHAKKGSDGNTLLNVCNKELLSPENPVPFKVQPPIPPVTIYKNICSEQLPYVWNRITITQGGAAAATFTTQAVNGCDSVTVLNLAVDAPPLQRVSSAAICEGERYRLPWDSSVATAGTFTHNYKNTKGCDSVVEQVAVTVHPVAKKIQQVRFCRDSLAMLSAGEGFVAYTWSTGNKEEFIVINKPGVYTAQATDAIGCVAKDTFTAEFYPDPRAAFGDSSFLCANSNETQIAAGNGFLQYLWSNGNREESITVNSAGSYWVTLTDAHYCVATDTTTLVIAPLPSHFLPPALSKCLYGDVVLSPIRSFAGYLWSNGSKNQTTKVRKEGVYWLQATDNNGCAGKEFISVADSVCGLFISLPAAFTPNGDGRNDGYKALVSGTVLQFKIILYNRWGEVVFTTGDYTKEWNGTRNGAPQPNGTYIYVCQYQFAGAAPAIQKGTLILMR